MRSFTLTKNLTQKLITASIFALAILTSQTSWAREVNVLSSRQAFLMKPFIDVFEKDTGIKVNMIFLKKGAIERLARQPGMFDVVLTVDIANLSKMAEKNLFQPIRSKLVDEAIPAQYRDPNHLWIALTERARIFYYSKDRIKPEALSTYEDLASPKFRGRLCSRSGYHDYNIALVSSLIAANGVSQTKAWLTGIKANLARKPQGNDRAQVRAIHEGLCDVAIGNSYYMGHMLANADQRPWAASASIFFPNQDGRGTHVNVSGAAIAASAENVAEATALIEFLSGNLAQYMYAEVNHEYPVKQGTRLSSIVSGFGNAQAGVEQGQFKRDSLSIATLAKYRKQAIQLLNEVRFDQ